MKAVFVVAFLAAACVGASQSTPVSDPNPTNPAASNTPTPAAERRPSLTTEMRGDIAMARKEYRAAIDLYKSVTPQTHVSLNKTGIAYHQLADMDQAARYYERAIKAKKDYPEALNNLGTIHYARKSYRRAVSQYNRALKVAPNSASIHSNLGTAWFARRKYDRAAECYQRALELDPDVFEHRSTNGVLLQERSVEEKAKFHFYLAKVYAKAGAVERALLYVRKALEEGFKDRGKFVEEPEFAGLQQLPEFKELMALQPRVL